MNFFRSLFLFFLVLLIIDTTHNSALAIETIRISFKEKAIDLTKSIEIFPYKSKHFQTSTAPSADGIIRRIEVVSNELKTKGWASFALINTSDQQIDRLIVAPHSRLVNSGIFWPDLGENRIHAITPSEGFALDRQHDPNADVFHVTLNPGAVITFIAELSSPNLPKLYLWSPDAYKDTINKYTLFQGIVIGIAGLLSLFLTILFIVRGTSLFPAAAAFSWSSLAYICIDFGFLNNIIQISEGTEQLWRAGAEVSLSATLIIFLFTYLNLNRWHDHFNYGFILWLTSLILIAGIAIYHPPFAAGLARLYFAATILFGSFLIIGLSFNGYDRAIMLIPSWVMASLWTFTYGITIFGIIDNDIVQPALAGGLILVLLLIGFTIIQHAFTGGFLDQGLFSDMEKRCLAITGSGDIFWDWDVIRDKVTTQPDIALTLHLTANSLSGPIRNWLPTLHAEDRDIFRAVLDIILEHRKGRIAEDLRLRSADGHYQWFSLRARPIVGANGEVIRCIGTMINITYDKKTKARLIQNSVHDTLTGLPNYQNFLNHIEILETLMKKNPVFSPTIFVIDIDNFKKINQTFGISAGDTILLTLARRLSRLLKPGDFLYRFSRNRFSFLILSEKDHSSVNNFAKKTIEIIQNPINFARQEIILTASIGFVTWSSDYEKIETFLKDAELAMYQAKRLGGNRFEAFHKTFRLVVIEHLQLEENFKKSFEQNEFIASYQPIISLNNQNVFLFNSFLFWENVKKEMIQTPDFISLAESQNIVQALWIFEIESAAKNLLIWQNSCPNTDVSICCNVPSTQLIESDFVGDIRAILMRHKIKPSSFHIAFSESQLMENPEKMLPTLVKLKTLGVKLCLDDFGLGHSSLAYLTHLPFDSIRTKNSLSNNAVTDVPFLKMIIGIGNEFGLNTIVKGDISKKDILKLKKIGYTYIQSDLLNPSVHPDSVTTILTARKSNAHPSSGFFSFFHKSWTTQNKKSNID